MYVSSLYRVIWKFQIVLGEIRKVPTEVVEPCPIYINCYLYTK